MAIQEDETPEQYANLKCLEWENTKRNLKSALMVPHAISVYKKPCECITYLQVTFLILL